MALDLPDDWQILLHLDHTLPHQTGKTAVYTTVRLHYVDKCQLNQYYHISIQSNKNITCQFQPVMFVSFRAVARILFQPRQRDEPGVRGYPEAESFSVPVVGYPKEMQGLL